MANALNFTLNLTDYLGPKVAAAIERVQKLTSQVERPHRLNVDTSQAQSGLQGIMGLVGKLGLATALATGAKEIIGLGTDMEQTRISFEIFTGSVAKGNEAIARLQKFANLTPFDDDEVIASGRTLLAAGYQVSELEKKLQTLGNVSAGTRKPLQELVSIYTKNKASGLIQGEDLNQLSEAGIGMTQFAKVLGVSEDKVRKLGSEGKITFKTFDQVLENMGGKTGAWGKMMDRQSETVAGRFSSLVGLGKNMLTQVGEGINPILGKIVNGGNSILTFVRENTGKIKQIFQPLQLALQPLIDTYDRLMEQQYGNADAGSVLATVFNRVGTVIKLVSPFVKVAATLLGTVWEQGQRVVNTLSKFWETSPRLQKFFAGLYGGALAAFKGIAEAVGKYLGGVGTFIEGVFSGDFHKMGDGLKTTLAAVLDTQDVGKKSAVAFAQGWHDGLPKSSLFDVKARVKGATGADAASAFLSGGNGSAKPTAPALTAAATGGGVSGMGGKGITNIHLTVNRPFENTTITAGTPQEAARQTAGMFRDWFMAELNDVNTLASAN